MTKRWNKRNPKMRRMSRMFDMNSVWKGKIKEAKRQNSNVDKMGNKGWGEVERKIIIGDVLTTKWLQSKPLHTKLAKWKPPQHQAISTFRIAWLNNWSHAHVLFFETSETFLLLVIYLQVYTRGRWNRQYAHIYKLRPGGDHENGTR